MRLTQRMTVAGIGAGGGLAMPCTSAAFGAAGSAPCPADIMPRSDRTPRQPRRVGRLDNGFR